MLLEHIDSPADLRTLTPEELATLSAEIRAFIVETVTATGGHLGSNLGVVELTLAVHRTFDSPRDVILWDTGHQAYVHKLVTGRARRFPEPEPGRAGCPAIPSRAESEHDWVENSHASTALSYAHGIWPPPSSSRGSRPPGGGRPRRRGPHRGHGLRGPQQPGPLGQAASSSS